MHEELIHQLQNNWAKLGDLDRAKAVKTIHRSGMSIRNIATQLNCSDALLRHLLIALDAPIEDRVLAREGKISTNELVRRAKAAGLRHEAQHHEEVALDRERAARQAAKKIMNWLAGNSLGARSCERVIEDVRWEYALRDSRKDLPPSPKNLEIALPDLIDRCRPEFPRGDNADDLNWYRDWLCRWIYYAFPVPYIRDTALDIALEMVWHM